MMYWFDHGMGWWSHAGMGLGMVLFWAFVVAGMVGLVGLVLFLARDAATPGWQSPAAQSPEQILAARFARGEIGEAEYEERIAVLRQPQRPSG